MDWLAGDGTEAVIPWLALAAFSIVALAEVNHRYQGRRKCLCNHPCREHYMRSGRCEHMGHIGGLPFSCPCSTYHPAPKVAA